MGDHGIAMPDSERLPPGRQPYDQLVGMRVGGVAGALVGAVLAAVVGSAWLLLAGAVLGGAAGYLFERRNVRRDKNALPPRRGD